METLAALNKDINIYKDKSNHTTVAEACTNTPAQTESNVTFGEFEHMYNKVLKVEDQLLCSDEQDEAKIDCNKLKNSFKIFQ